MSYIGNTVTTQGFTPAVDFFSGNASTTAFTLSKPVASVAQVQAVIENVPQNPNSAYTVSGNTITFTSAPPSGTNNIYVYYTSPITQVIQPSQGTVGITQLTATGSPSSSTYLRGDNTWATVSGGVTSAVAGTGISVSGATGAVTFTNTGVTSIVAGTGISISGATGAVTVTASAYPLTSGTAVSASGTSVDFTGLPSWVKRITVMYSGLSQSGGSSSLIQLGTSGGIITSGYWSYCDNGPAITSSAGFVVGEDTGSFADSGTYTICLLSSTIWTGGGNFVRDNNGVMKSCAGRLTGAGTIDRVRITTVNGTDTFDAGSINILYE